MEKVEVVKAIPGILEVGDILISPQEGLDFSVEETKITGKGTSEKYICLDYITVSENIPQFFQFVENDPEPEVEATPRTLAEIEDRYEFFKEQYENSPAGSEPQVVYKNLMWFIEWLQGKTELI